VDTQHYEWLVKLSYRNPKFQEIKSRIPQYVGFRLLRQLPGSLATYSNSTKSLAGTNMWFDDIYNNATAVNAPYGVNYTKEGKAYSHTVLLLLYRSWKPKNLSSADRKLS
jgi:hypothetical protein